MDAPVSHHGPPPNKASRVKETEQSKYAINFLSEKGSISDFLFLGDAAMIGKLFRSHKQSRPERPTFRPMLESLERREVPSCAQTSAAFDALPTDVNNLVTSLTARPVNVSSVNTNLATVSNDLFLLQFGARNFVVPDRLQIDNALVVNGITLVFQGYNNFPFVPGPQFISTVRLGASAIEAGALDFLVTGFFPETSGDCTLM